MKITKPFLIIPILMAGTLFSTNSVADNATIIIKTDRDVTMKTGPSSSSSGNWWVAQGVGCPSDPTLPTKVNVNNTSIPVNKNHCALDLTHSGGVSNNQLNLSFSIPDYTTPCVVVLEAFNNGPDFGSSTGLDIYSSNYPLCKAYVSFSYPSTLTAVGSVQLPT